MSIKKICIVATDGWSLVNFRGPLIRQWIKDGYEVTCISIESKEEFNDRFESLGASYYCVAGSRTGIGPVSGLKMIKAYRKAFQKIRPDMCFLYMSKPIVFGGIAAVQEHVPHINILVNGLENAFYRHTFKDAIVRMVMSAGYRYVDKHADNVFYQNHDDMDYCISHALVSSDKTAVIGGSGVDMDKFIKSPLPEIPSTIMVARLLWSKGVREYLGAARIVKQKYSDFKMLLLGGLDSNDEAITKDQLEKYVEDGVIEYHEPTYDVYPFLQRASIFVLPSYHEGLPRSVIEAMSVGRAIITTDVPGCRETVVEGENGFIVPSHDSEKLADCIIYMIEHPDKLKKMAEKSYEICRTRFDVNIVNREMNEKMFKF